MKIKYSKGSTEFRHRPAIHVSPSEVAGRETAVVCFLARKGGQDASASRIQLGLGAGATQREEDSSEYIASLQTQLAE
jgi:hypothetical protein